jgi:hypothetical protein
LDTHFASSRAKLKVNPFQAKGVLHVCCQAVNDPVNSIKKTWFTSKWATTGEWVTTPTLITTPVCRYYLLCTDGI